MGQTTSDLISNIRIRGSFPSGDSLFTNSNFLSILNDEMQNVVIPLLTQVNEEYFLVYSDTVVSSGTEAYRIPRRAIGSMLRDVQLIDSSGSIVSLPRLFEEDRYSTTAGPQGYYLKSNQILLSPTPTSATDTLRQAYFRRPSRFVLSTACARIDSISDTTIVVSSLPSTMTTGTSIDFVQANSPYDLLQMDSAIASASGTTLTFASVPSDLAVGDYICLAGESCVPMVPEELINILVQAALCVCLSSKKDSGVKLELEKLEQMKQSILSMLQPRTKSNDVKIKSGALLSHFRGG